MNPTKDDLKQALAALTAIAEAIQTLGEVPSGHLYARVMGHMDIHAYERIIATLIKAGLVVQDRSYMLRWTGPARVEKGGAS